MTLSLYLLNYCLIGNHIKRKDFIIGLQWKNDEPWINIITKSQFCIGYSICEMNHSREVDKIPPPVKYASIIKNVLWLMLQKSICVDFHCCDYYLSILH